jgi:predicted AlkP superfamily phosphohydrolase/phosphomutase
MMDRISSDLESIVDPETGINPITKVYRREEVYSGEYAFEMPDLLVGYTPGYRAASASVLGDTEQDIINLNPYAWSGDHSMARDLVPGVVFSSHKMQKATPTILDLPVTILEFFGLEKPEQMEGSSIFKA